MAAHPDRAYRVAGAILAGCLIGALAFYLLASWLFDPVVAPLLDWLGLGESFQQARERMSGGNLFWAVFAVSVTPVPFQLATLGAGATGGSIIVFMAAVAASRAIRYYGLAWLARKFGPQVVEMAGGRRRLLIGGAGLLIGLYVLYQLFTSGG
jgi:membrane protein YqaA with SNARE-associated domain